MKYFCVLVMFSVLFSCQPTENHHSHGKKEKHLENTNKVVLNNGKKWIADSTTTLGINNLTQITKMNDSSLNMKDTLEAEFKLIFKRCTMKGPGHDQLHNYLLPLNKKIQNLNQPPSEQELNDLQQYLVQYYNYFE